MVQLNLAAVDPTGQEPVAHPTKSCPCLHVQNGVRKLVGHHHPQQRLLVLSPTVAAPKLQQNCHSLEAVAQLLSLAVQPELTLQVVRVLGRAMVLGGCKWHPGMPLRQV